jgi:hypothetical protein
MIAQKAARRGPLAKACPADPSPVGFEHRLAAFNCMAREMPTASGV